MRNSKSIWRKSCECGVVIEVPLPEVKEVNVDKPKKKRVSISYKQEGLPSKRKRLFADANGICYLCEKPMLFSEATTDHVYPKSRGGSDRYENLKLTHRKCNGKKGSLLLSELKLPFKF